jgi:REP-associated tyrosine transposase
VALHAYCLRDNHYHLLIETPDGNPSLGMRQLNGVYTQARNKRYNKTGNLFQGRYKALLKKTDMQSIFMAVERGAMVYLVK